MTIAILDYTSGVLSVERIPDDTKDIEEYLYEKLNYNENISWMEIVGIYMDISLCC